MSSFSQGVRNWQLKKLHQANPKNSKYPGFAKIKSILILGETENGDWPEPIFQWTLKLLSEGKEVYTFQHWDRKRTKEESKGEKPLPKNTYFKDQTNWFGKPKLGEMAQKLPIQVDVIIDFTHGEKSANEFIFAGVKANFTVGVAHGPYDLTVSVNDGDYKATVDEMDQLLRLINK
ncbi:MAG: hypothetical protein SchgKO_22220 [Schleiferiaceae bacterium]